MLKVSLTQTEPNVILVTFTGVVTPEEVERDGRFIETVQALRGAPFRVVCDFENAAAMSPEVADIFVQSQAFAIRSGLERDAFVSSSKVVRLQLARVADESSRLRALGPLRFFDTLDEAYAYILEPSAARPATHARDRARARRLG